MNRIVRIAAPFAAAALLAAGSAFAGGAACSGDHAKSASAGHHCDGMGAGASSASAGHSCTGKGEGASSASAMSCPTVKANQAVYSFAVPGAFCGDCAHAIQTALMAHKGVSCAHVDLESHTAYIIADKNVDKKAITKTIQTAGFKNSFKAQGPKVQAEFAKVMTSSMKEGASGCPYMESKESKAKDKI
jgi:copper chaperone CopZ